MMELRDTSPDVNVLPAEYLRLLGYPRDRVLTDRARELADWARDWYSRHGRPWIYARAVGDIDTAGSQVRLGGCVFNSPGLQKTLRDAGAQQAIVVAVGAGAELETEAQIRWQDGKPDEYFFLEVYGSAVVEHLVVTTGARLCAWAESRHQAVLPHYSPGYSDWDISEQQRLLELLNLSGDRYRGQLPIEVLESGMLRPKKSLLAVFGVTPHVDRVSRLSELVPCERCSFAPCQYRRAAYRRAMRPSDPELGGDSRTDMGGPGLGARGNPLTTYAVYTTSTKALRRWARERLILTRHDDGAIDATFRYDGTTCTNMGRPMEFQYRVSLGPAADGYAIRSQHCGPAAGDEGHTHMCRYLTNPEDLMVAIDREKPLLGQPLNDVLSWARPPVSAGCYCEPESRKHKWGLVLETIHYALANDLDRSTDEPAAKEMHP